LFICGLVSQHASLRSEFVANKEDRRSKFTAGIPQNDGLDSAPVQGAFGEFG
jgi:hypothetical protein